MLGAGNHAKALLDAFDLLHIKPQGIVDPDFEVGSAVLDVPIIDPETISGESIREVSLVNGVGGAHSCGPRNTLFNSYISRGYRFRGLLHPSAHTSQLAQIHESAQIMAGVVIQTSVKISQNCLINTSAVIEHDCQIEAGSFVGPGAVVCGNVKISAGVFIGAGAIILPGLRICGGATVGAGSVVTKDILEPMTVVGIPARRIP